MSAFGRRSGVGNSSGTGSRPAFGVARPMQGGPVRPSDLQQGEQFPPINSVPLPGAASSEPMAPEPDSMSSARASATFLCGPTSPGGANASVVAGVSGIRCVVQRLGSPCIVCLAVVFIQDDFVADRTYFPCLE